MHNITKCSNGKSTNLPACDAIIGMLNDTQEELCLASDELLRMEDESGIALTKKQTAKVSNYSKASKRIKRLLFITDNKTLRI